MSLKRNIKILRLAVLVACVVSVPFLAQFAGVIGHSARRINREHGLWLPASATNFQCYGDAWLRMISDCGAASTFEMAKSDLPSLISQITVRESTSGVATSIFPANPRYQVTASWFAGLPQSTYECKSPTGDSLSVQIWPIDDSRVGVCLYTDWN